MAQRASRKDLMCAQVQVAKLVDAGKLRTTLGQVIEPIHAANLRSAHAQLETGRTIGKIVLENWA